MSGAAQRLAAALDNLLFGDGTRLHVTDRWTGERSLMGGQSLADAILVDDPHLAQDIADGEALRRLREVMADDDGLGLFITRWGVVQASVAVIPAAQHGKGDPVSQAADACREAIEAQRPEARA